MLIKVLISVSAEQALLDPQVCWRRRRGGGGQQATCLVAKQAVEFPQVLASYLIMMTNIADPMDWKFIICVGNV